MSTNYIRTVMQNYFCFKIMDEVIVEVPAQETENAAAIISAGLEKVK
ncbi:hypothetical protein QWY22_11145 [Planococcus liqunii]|nr:hypothetical protein [Planococcus sp. N056]WKA49458.1 hypothetical protein QWY22_11145 [Planococcus sp. N056]